MPRQKIIKSRLFLLLIAVLVFFFFKNAFSLGFFKDDLYFLNIAQANSLNGFLFFFNPFKSHGYRPIPIELFYFMINTFHLNFFVIHLIIFAVYFIGLFYLYRSLLKISQNLAFSRITTLLYSLSFIHVFQLYAAWNFQEVCLFTFLSISFSALINKKPRLSFLFYLGALLSKETAIFYPLFLATLYLANRFLKFKLQLNFKSSYLWLTGLLAVIFGLLIKYELSQFAQNPLYAIHLELKLMLNNLMWLGLWALGLPSYLPDYMVSILQPPLPDFYKALATQESRLYFYILMLFLVIFFFTVIYLLFKKQYRRTILYLLVFCLAFFTLFNLPTLPTIHKWMVRLTLPLIFVSLFQGLIITLLYQHNRLTKFVAVFLLSLYLFWNYYGTVVHESASTYKLESAIYFKSREFFDANRQKILTNDYIFIKDFKKRVNPWGGSQKLNDTYWGQNFVRYVFPEKRLVMLYNFETKKVPKNSFVVSSLKLLPY